MVCVSDSLFVLLFGPWVLLFIIEAALCIIYVRECQQWGISLSNIWNRRREVTPTPTVSNV